MQLSLFVFMSFVYMVCDSWSLSLWLTLKTCIYCLFCVKRRDTRLPMRVHLNLRESCLCWPAEGDALTVVCFMNYKMDRSRFIRVVSSLREFRPQYSRLTLQKVSQCDSHTVTVTLKAGEHSPCGHGEQTHCSLTWREEAFLSGLGRKCPKLTEFFRADRYLRLRRRL